MIGLEVFSMWILDIEGQRLQTETEERESPTAEQRDKTQLNIQHLLLKQKQKSFSAADRPSKAAKQTNTLQDISLTLTRRQPGVGNMVSGGGEI